MKRRFKGWEQVAQHLRDLVSGTELERKLDLKPGQSDSLLAMAERLKTNGVIIADEVGMGKTRIAASLAKGVIRAGGRVAILVPPGLGYQWGAELRTVGMDAPTILRSLRQFFQAWQTDEPPEPWFEQDVLLISHAFSHWRLGESSAPWRWGLLPELYARWRQHSSGRFPRGYHSNEILGDEWVQNAAKRIIEAIVASSASHHSRNLIQDLADKTPWPAALDAAAYGRNDELRPWLEKAVGLGLGVFDLVIIDEAHKSRGQDSSLNRLLEEVVLPSDKGARRLAMTATPVELDAQQWMQILQRIGADSRESASPAISAYAEAVRNVRQCPSDALVRSAYQDASVAFKKTLDPYLLRRDKREDPAVLAFQRCSCGSFHAYRREREILVETTNLSNDWKQAVCAAEALSFVAQQADDSIAKRLRLTLGNGHGIAALLDQFHRHDVDDKKQSEDDGCDASSDGKNGVHSTLLDKRAQRAQWWQKVILQASQSHTSGDAALYDHPAILAAVAAAEEVCERGEKVLVFGRFTRPLRALAELLNARAMLRSLDNQQPWPQSKVHENEWKAIEAAHQQLQRTGALNRADLDKRLDKQYRRLEEERRRTRDNLVENIEKGITQSANKRKQALFRAFKEAAKHENSHQEHVLVVVTKAIQELIDTRDAAAHDLAGAFADLIEAVSDRDQDDADDNDTLDTAKAADIWTNLEKKLRDEYSRTEGGYARLMYGETKPETRRLLQLAFNRRHGHPKVLVAQSVVGREGLNLHKACRTVILLHPEWNPGVVEQQIGRVDRMGSLWEEQLEQARTNAVPVSDLPRIEICPVIFRGTYDEQNWLVLRERWDDLRAQLHGIVISPVMIEKYGWDREEMKVINAAAPNFSPPKLETPAHQKSCQTAKG